MIYSLKYPHVVQEHSHGFSSSTRRVVVQIPKSSLFSKDYKLIDTEEYLDFVRDSPATLEASQSFKRMLEGIKRAVVVIHEGNCIPMFHSSFRSDKIIKVTDKVAKVFDHFDKNHVWEYEPRAVTCG